MFIDITVYFIYVIIMLLLCCIYIYIYINFDNGIAFQVYWTCWILDFK